MRNFTREQSETGSEEFPKPATVEEAVKLFNDSYYSSEAARKEIVEYLKENPNNITEFCLQVTETYKNDPAGTIMLARLITDLIEKI